ncbi:MAG: aminomethyltransferase family protein [Enterobacteriaceae bacterium]|jgi:glycine cleavage system aminomethyltransferase T|nr:aminomethyltransferase family protein [Enterobacteriaceae bacterium]
MKTLYDLHQKHNAKMGLYNNKSVPASYNSAEVEYKALRENALLVDYSHMSIVSVIGDDAWILVNHIASADVSTIRDEQGIYSLVLNEDGTIRGDMYVLCSDDGYYILSENMSADDIIECLNGVLALSDELDIQEAPEIKAVGDDWGTVLLEGPYSWEVLSEIYGFDIIGLPYHEFMITDDELMIFRCGKHGEFAYMAVGKQDSLTDLWEKLIDAGEKFQLKTGGLDYQKTVRVENTGWDQSIYAGYSRNPVELQLQWAIQYDKEDFVGKSAVEEFSRTNAERKLIGMIPVSECAGIETDDKVLVNGESVGVVIKSVFSPALQSFIALALIDGDYAYSDINGFEIQTSNGNIIAKTQSVPFLYNFSMLVSPTEHSFIDESKPKSSL